MEDDHVFYFHWLYIFNFSYVNLVNKLTKKSALSYSFQYGTAMAIFLTILVGPAMRLQKALEAMNLKPQ